MTFQNPYFIGPCRTIAQRLDKALAIDIGAARKLREWLGQEGRASHPATLVLDRIEADILSDADRMDIAAIAFEAAVRVHHGASAGVALRDHNELLLPPQLIRIEQPQPWEPEHAQGHPHPMMDWREAVRLAGLALREGQFTMPAGIPGGALLVALLDCAPDRSAVASELLGHPPRDETLDPVATGGHFLALALPNAIDLDLELRAWRERGIVLSAPVVTQDMQQGG